jgi:hypothetical protein
VLESAEEADRLLIEMQGFAIRWFDKSNNQVIHTLAICPASLNSYEIGDEWPVERFIGEYLEDRQRLVSDPPISNCAVILSDLSQAQYLT